MQRQVGIFRFLLAALNFFCHIAAQFICLILKRDLMHGIPKGLQIS